MKRALRRGLALLLCCLVFSLPVFAQGSAADLDLDRTGEITLTVKDKKGIAPTRGTIACIQVARVVMENGNLSYELTNGFEKTGLSLEDFIRGDQSASSLVKAVEKVLPAGAQKQTCTIRAGKVSFPDLELGLYLIRQEHGFKNHESIQSFLVTLPMNGDEGWIYEVNATPKVGTVSQKPPKSPPSGGYSKLPQTGQLNWPVPVLAVAGLVLFSIGWLLTREKYEEDPR